MSQRSFTLYVVLAYSECCKLFPLAWGATSYCLIQRGYWDYSVSWGCERHAISFCFAYIKKETIREGEMMEAWKGEKVKKWKACKRWKGEKVKRWLTPCKLVTLLLVTLSTNNGEKMAAPINLLTRFLVNLSPCSLAPLLPCLRFGL